MDKTKLLLIALLVVGVAILIRLSFPVQQQAVETKEKTKLVPPGIKELDDSPPPISNSAPSSGSITVPASAEDFDSGISVRKGQTVILSASGSANASATSSDGSFRWVGPDGWGSSPSFSQGRKGPLPSGSSFMALCYRVGRGTLPINDGLWQLAGSSRRFTASSSGTIHFTVNDDIEDRNGNYQPSYRTNNQGQFNVQVRVEN